MRCNPADGRVDFKEFLAYKNPTTWHTKTKVKKKKRKKREQRTNLLLEVPRHNEWI
jgi:hypothetical protein